MIVQPGPQAPPHFFLIGYRAPPGQLGTDFDLSSRALLNVELTWNRLRADLENGGVRLTRLKMDPLALGFGVGFRF